jgi:hypothetical protein
MATNTASHDELPSSSTTVARDSSNADEDRFPEGYHLPRQRYVKNETTREAEKTEEWKKWKNGGMKNVRVEEQKNGRKKERKKGKKWKILKKLTESCNNARCSCSYSISNNGPASTGRRSPLARRRGSIRAISSLPMKSRSVEISDRRQSYSDHISDADSSWLPPK